MSVPSFATRSPALQPRRRAELLGAIALAAGLAGQWAWQSRAPLAASETLRPLLERACGVLHCTLPPWREPAAIAMLSRDVIVVPGQPGVLRVQASFRNDARWAQAWPGLQLTLSDADGRVLGRRLFLPRDYLGGGERPATLAAGASTQVAFDIVEPSTAAVAFDFRFR